MSCKADASYWGVIKGPKPACEDILKTMKERDIIPTYLDAMDGVQPDEDSGQNMATIQLEVPSGSMGQWTEAEQTFTRLAADFPSLVITLDEQCEEPCFPARRFTFINGELKETKYGRILDVDDVDAVTVAACIDYLRECGESGAADMLAAHF